MQASNYIVIGQTSKAFHPKIVLRTDNEEHARAHAHTFMRSSKCDVQVFDYYTGLCILALTDEPKDPS